MVVYDLEIREAVLDPIGDAREHLITMFVAVTDYRAGENCGLMHILMFDFGRGDVEFLMECG